MEVFLFAYALGANLPTVGTHSVFESWACHRGLELKDDICKNLDKYEEERWVVDYFHFDTPVNLMLGRYLVFPSRGHDRFVRWIFRVTNERTSEVYSLLVLRKE